MRLNEALEGDAAMRDAPGDWVLEESAMAIVLWDGKVLATRELIYGREALSLPKGHIEAGESRLDAAIRECFEETGVAVPPESYLKEGTPCVVEFIDHRDRRVRKTIDPVVFRVKDGGDPRPQERRVLFAGYMDVEEFLRDCAYDNVRAMLQQAIAE